MQMPVLPFELPVFSLELILIAGRAVALVTAFLLFAWAFGRWKRAAARDTQRVFEQLDLMLGELHSVSQAVAAINSRLDALSERVESDSVLQPASAGSAQRGYEIAMRMAKNGSSRDELMASCGITRHEAELLVRLHGAAVDRAPAAAELRPLAAASPPAHNPKLRSRLSVVG